ncbi:MAG: hypothetical protein SV375_20500 [Thermodesulfobacteriota bacterium]|nr:hypothetical protein [Thermodesulfobacteriota bacterium]
MIIITNIGPLTDDPGGERHYNVHVNRKMICAFKHHRKDGLAICLKKASEAVAEAEIQQSDALNKKILDTPDQE